MKLIVNALMLGLAAASGGAAFAQAPEQTDQQQRSQNGGGGPTPFRGMALIEKEHFERLQDAGF